MRESARTARPVSYLSPWADGDIDSNPAGLRGSPARRGGRSRPPLVECVAGWSARHRAAAIVGWLGFLLAAFISGQFVTGASVQQYDPGQAGQAEQVLHRLNVTTAPVESVLITAAGRTFADDPQLRQAAGQVVAALKALPRAAMDIRSPLGRAGRSLISANGAAALVTFAVAGPHASADATVVADLAAVARVQARFPHTGGAGDGRRQH